MRGWWGRFSGGEEGMWAVGGYGGGGVAGYVGGDYKPLDS